MIKSIKQCIEADVKLALRAGDKPRLSALRLMLAAIKQVEVDERIDLDDGRVIQIFGKMIKQRRDAIAQYTQAKRDDLADKERLEVEIIQAYLPKPLDEASINSIVLEVIEELSATSVKEMAKVVAVVKERLQGRADMAVVSAKIKERLT